MIWTINDLSAFPAAFAHAGDPDQAVIAAYVAQSRRPQQPQSRPGVRRYYYLLNDDPRVSLCAVGMPLDAWAGGAMCKVGTSEIIGEFKGNRHLVGRKGLRLQLQPLAWLNAPADEHYESGGQALEAVSFQVLDLDRAAQSQRRIVQQYQWK